MNIALGQNIKKHRELKGYSQEYMAHELDITQASYAKMENNNTKITVERLLKIAQLLETDITELLEMKKQTIYNQEFNDSSQNYQEIQNLHQENKEAMAKLIESYEVRLQEKDEQIGFLKTLLRDKN